MSQRVSKGKNKIMAETDLLPDIDQPKDGAKFGSRIQSATKRSSVSIHHSQTMQDKKGPIKAFEHISAKSSKDLEALHQKNIDDVQIIDNVSLAQSSKHSQRPTTLEPI